VQTEASGLVAESVPCATIDGCRAWSALVACAPKPKGNSKILVGVGKRCARCKKPERYIVASRKEDKQAEQTLTKLLRLVSPPDPIEVDCVLHVSIRLPIMKSWKQKKKEAALAGLCRPTSAKKATGPIPDLGNLEKLLDDALESARWVVNDSLIAQRRSEKIYHPTPGYVITLRELPTWKE